MIKSKLCLPPWSDFNFHFQIYLAMHYVVCVCSKLAHHPMPCPHTTSVYVPSIFTMNLSIFPSFPFLKFFWILSTPLFLNTMWLLLKKESPFSSVLTSLLTLGPCGLELYSSIILSCLIATVAIIILFLNKLNKRCSHVQCLVIGLCLSASFLPNQENRLRFGGERAEMTGMKLNLSWYFK